MLRTFSCCVSPVQVKLRQSIAADVIGHLSSATRQRSELERPPSVLQRSVNRHVPALELKIDQICTSSRSVARDNVDGRLPVETTNRAWQAGPSSLIVVVERRTGCIAARSCTEKHKNYEYSLHFDNRVFLSNYCTIHNCWRYPLAVNKSMRRHYDFIVELSTGNRHVCMVLH